MPIHVTKSYLPPLEDYVKYLQEVWESGHVTNHGRLVCDLETKLREMFGVEHVVLVTNGTIALQVAYRAVGLSHEVITTPFSYVATTSALAWEGCEPVFADIESASLCIDPVQVEAAVTEATTGIVATHVYGNPCDLTELARIAKQHDLKLVYDAAHAFAVDVDGKSVLGAGDASTLSFHATKLFHTVEGGAILTNDDEVAHRARYLRNFGHDGPEAFFGIGINGKMSELQGAMGLTLLPHVERIIAGRRGVSEQYDALLAELPLRRPALRAGTTYNYAYYPVVFDDEAALLRAKVALEGREIHPRRYFYPSLNRLPYTRPSVCEVAEAISARVLCLPLHPELTSGEVNRVVDGLREAL